jgi:hypothetical protein
MDNIKKLMNYFCQRCLKGFDKPAYLNGFDGIVAYKYCVCPICKCDKITKIDTNAKNKKK